VPSRSEEPVVLMHHPTAHLSRSWGQILVIHRQIISNKEINPYRRLLDTNSLSPPFRTKVENPIKRINAFVNILYFRIIYYSYYDENCEIGRC
jgi:hypothetical protein